MGIKMNEKGIIQVEEWRVIPGYHKYQASTWGRIRHGEEILTPTIFDGYWRIKLSENGKKYHCKICHLILETFVGPCPFGHVAHHKDLNKLNDFLFNLEYMGRCVHSKFHRVLSLKNDPSLRFKGFCSNPHPGEKNGRAKLSKEDILKIRLEAEKGISCKAISVNYKISAQHTHDIVKKKRWKHL